MEIIFYNIMSRFIKLFDQISHRRNYWIGLQRPNTTDCSVCCDPYDCRKDEQCTARVDCRRQWVWTDQSRMLDDSNNLIYDNWHTEKPYGDLNRHVAFMFSGTGVWNDVRDDSIVPGIICKRSKYLLSIVLNLSLVMA